jgi:uncharacterized protein YdaU (DUF1376 family)
MGERIPAFSFYAKDFISGTVTLSLAERGAYITLLSYQWDHGAVPDDATARQRLLGCTKREADAVWVTLLSKFRQGEDGLWRNIRLELERNKQISRRSALITNGLKGGRPPKNQNDNQTETNRLLKQEPNQNLSKSLSSSSSSSDLGCKNHNQDRARAGGNGHAINSPTHFSDEEHVRAAAFCDRYAEFYERFRHGARYISKPNLDFLEALQLVRVWTDDARLDKLAQAFLTTDDEWVSSGSRTMARFRSRASWCDEKLRERGL